MVYDGVVAKIYDDEDKIFLFLVDPDTGIIKNGINISDDSNVYKDLTYDMLMVSEILLKDGTQDIKVDLDDFIEGEYGQFDIFIHIKDKLSFKLGKNDSDGNLKPRTIPDLVMDNEFESVALECIENTRNIFKEMEEKTNFQKIKALNDN